MARILAWPDTHVPFDHPKALQFLENTYNKYRCDRIIQLGDIADFASYSIKFSPDPNGYSPGHEYELMREGLEPYYKSFPQVDVVLGNHDQRPYKKLFASSLPRQLLKSISEFMGSPTNWVWHERGIEIEGVYYFHGENFTASTIRLAHEKFKCSTVSGHLHNIAACIYHQDRKRRYFNLSAGCLIDEKQYCFRYNEHNFNKAVLGAGIIIDGEVAFFEPFPKKWI